MFRVSVRLGFWAFQGVVLEGAGAEETLVAAKLAIVLGCRVEGVAHKL